MSHRSSGNKKRKKGETMKGKYTVEGLSQTLYTTQHPVYAVPTKARIIEQALSNSESAVSSPFQPVMSANAVGHPGRVPCLPLATR